MLVENYEGLNQTLYNTSSKHQGRVNIDASSRCNLRCPGCARTKDLERGKNSFTVEDLPIDYFKAFVRPENNIDTLTFNLTLSDPIYSGTLFQMLDHVNTMGDKRPKMDFSTNGSGRNERWWKKFTSGLRDYDRVAFAIDGLAETNHIYRVNAEWDSIILGINTLQETAREQNKIIRTIWRYVVFEHNYHQLLDAVDLASELGINRFRAILGDGRTPAHMLLKSVEWEELEKKVNERINKNISKV